MKCRFLLPLDINQHFSFLGKQVSLLNLNKRRQMSPQCQKASIEASAGPQEGGPNFGHHRSANNSHSLKLKANPGSTLRKHGSSLAAYMCLRLASKVLSIWPRRAAVISASRLPSLNIGSFTGGDRGLINRRRAGRGENTLMPFALSSGLETIPGSLSQEPGLPNCLGFIKDLQTSCSRKPPPVHSKSYRAFNTHISAATSRQLFTCAARMCDTHFESREGDLTSSQKTGGTTERQRLVSRFLPDSKRVKKKSTAAVKRRRGEGNRSSDKVAPLRQ